MFAVSELSPLICVSMLFMSLWIDASEVSDTLVADCPEELVALGVEPDPYAPALAAVSVVAGVLGEGLFNFHIANPKITTNITAIIAFDVFVIVC